MWLLMEGVVLYIILMKEFEKVNWKHYLIVTLLSYGKIHKIIIAILTYNSLTYHANADVISTHSLLLDII